MALGSIIFLPVVLTFKVVIDTVLWSLLHMVCMMGMSVTTAGSQMTGPAHCADVLNQGDISRNKKVLVFQFKLTDPPGL